MQYSNTGHATTTDTQTAVVNAFMRRVYNYMALALALSGVIAWAVVSIPAVFYLFYNAPTAESAGGPSMLFWAAIIGSLGIAFGLGMGITRIKFGTAVLLFGVYSICTGIMLSSVLLVYTEASVFKTFLVTAGTFGVMSIYGSTTKRDLTGMGNFLTMGLIGILIAMVVNIFLASPMVDFIVSILGVLIFTGLIAYDTQKLRAMCLQSANDLTTSKMAIYGAFQLYLDFINLFLFLLRFLGNRE